MKKILGLVVLVVLAASCGGDDRGTYEQAVRRFAQTACEKQFSCHPIAPGFPSVDACVNSFVNRYAPSALAEPAHCSDAELMACRNDYAVESCQAHDSNVQPSSCGPC